MTKINGPGSNSSLTKDIHLELPVPGQPLRPDRDLVLETYVITRKTTIKELKPALERYGLTKSGNRGQLIERLRDFANRRDEWTGLFQAGVKRKRGDITGSHTAAHSSKRIALMFQDSKTVDFPSKHQGGDSRTVQALTSANIAQNDEWADAVLTDSDNEHARTTHTSLGTALATISETRSESESEVQVSANFGRANTAAIAVAETSSADDESTYQAVVVRRMQRQLNNLGQNLLEKLGDIDSKLNEQKAGACHTTHSPTDSASSGGCTPNNCGTASIERPSAPNVPQALAPPAAVAVSATCHDDLNAIPSTDLVTVSFAGEDDLNAIPSTDLVTVSFAGEDFRFDKTQVPVKPPVRHYSRNLPDLFRDWDGPTSLVLNARAIPLKFWPEIYKNRKVGKSKAWEALKVMWGNWKFIVEEKNRLGSEDAFWNTYCDDEGDHLQYQSILDQLKRNRADNDNADANAARTYFDGDLACPAAGDTFRYMKNGASLLCTSDSKIAERWRALLEQQPLLTGAWAVKKAVLDTFAAGLSSGGGEIA